MRLLLLVTARRTTCFRSSILGVTGAAIGTSSWEFICNVSPSSLCSASESCILFVPRLRLSRRDRISSLVGSSRKYPALILILLSDVLIKGGD